MTVPVPVVFFSNIKAKNEIKKKLKIASGYTGIYFFRSI